MILSESEKNRIKDLYGLATESTEFKKVYKDSKIAIIHVIGHDTINSDKYNKWKDGSKNSDGVYVIQFLGETQVESVPSKKNLLKIFEISKNICGDKKNQKIDSTDGDWIGAFSLYIWRPYPKLDEKWMKKMMLKGDDYIILNMKGQYVGLTKSEIDKIISNIKNFQDNNPNT